MLLVLLLFFLVLHLAVEIVPSELAFVLCFFANEKTLFTIAFDADLILLHLDGLVNVEFEDLYKTSICILLWTL